MCDRVCRNEHGLQLHQLQKHPQTEELNTVKNVQPQSAEGTYICGLCPPVAQKARTWTKKELRKHQKNGHNGGPCRICGNLLKHGAGLADHSEVKHGLSFRISWEDKGCREATGESSLPQEYAFLEFMTSPMIIEVERINGIDGLGRSKVLLGLGDKADVTSTDSGNSNLLDVSPESQPPSEPSVSEAVFGDECSDGSDGSQQTQLIPLLSEINLGKTPFVHASAGLESSDAGSELSNASVPSDSALTPSPSIGSAESEITSPRAANTRAKLRLGMHCRICQKDPSEELTATMCGHLFCKSCITEEVITRSACPVCNNAVLLYHLFRIDLSA